ncbi:DUF3025 domain-containing protein [Glaciecola sp. 1036]|uniref:DUF3025 domain-containing protein n=1 Tax=Alteromonadaceae TaxID=72275 RepID=UPI003CFF0708
MDNLNHLISQYEQGELSQAFAHIFKQLPLPLTTEISLHADGLNALRPNNAEYSFIDQDSCQLQGYYEEIIYRDRVIPTRRNNLHDLCNGLIWLLMPKTKALLNELHIEQIRKIGLSPRGRVRDRITHFDECGIVLFCHQVDVITDLSQHNWQSLFIHKKELWHRNIRPFVFGHANLEMLLAPFIGLTAKALVINLDCPVDSLSQCQLDQHLANYLVTNNLFERPRPLKPLPILGVPGWYGAEQTTEFYGNKDYFMPLREKASQ